MAIPVGWQEHPHYPGWMYELANPANVQRIQPPPVAAPAMPVAPATPAHWPATPTPSYGLADSSLIEGELARSKRRGEKQSLVYIDFPNVSRVGDEVEIMLRMLPPWSPTVRLPYLNGHRHRLNSAIVPDAKTSFVSIDCPLEATGKCAVCDKVEALMASGSLAAEQLDEVKRYRRSPRIRWQGINLSDPNKHWMQKADANGSPVLDANGHPIWEIVPGVMFTSEELKRSILLGWKHSGDPTHPESGYPIIVKKSKTGPEQFNIKYSSTRLDKCPLDEAYRGVLSNLVDLSALVWYRDESVMHQIAENIHRKVSTPASGMAMPVPPTGMWLPHPQAPGYEYNPSTGQVRPAAPPMPAPLTYMTAMPTVMAPHMGPPGRGLPIGYPGAPPGPPMGLPPGYPATPLAPPMAAPPGPPMGAPVGPLGPPPGAPPYLPPPAAPGWRAGAPAGPVVPPPPPPGMGPVMSPGDLERHLAGPRGGDVPF